MLRYRVLPRTARYLVAESSPDIGAGFAFFMPSRSASRHRALSAANRLGAARALPRPSRADQEVSVALAMAADQYGFGPPPVIHMGAARANRKPVGVLMGPDGPAAVVKMGVSPLTNRLISNEADALLELSRSSGQQLDTPELLGRGELSGRVFSIQRALPVTAEGTHDILSTEALAAVIGISGRQVVGPMLDSNWYRSLSQQIHELPGGPDSGSLLALLARWSESAGGVEVPFGDWHGDFTIWNSRATSDGRAMIWDWERFEAGIPMGFDLLHFRFTLVQESAPTLDAVRTTLVESPDLLAPLGYDRESAQITATAYLLTIGTRYVTDDQRSFGTESGRVSEWLGPILEAGWPQPRRLRRRES